MEVLERGTSRSELLSVLVHKLNHIWLTSMNKAMMQGIEETVGKALS